MGNPKRDFYPTWQEASEVCRRAGIKTIKEYDKRRAELDSRLPSNTHQYYQDWPGWKIFLFGNESKKYVTWQEASAVCLAAGISNSVDYSLEYKAVDPKLPSNPDIFYSDWPSWSVFFGRGRTDIYPTWQEASEVCCRAGIKSYMQYYERGKKFDSRLPSRPDRSYKDWPGWNLFLQVKSTRTFKTRRPYIRIQNASKLNGTGPAKPNVLAIAGKNKSKLYRTWQEASLASQTAGIVSHKEYAQRFKQADPRLPHNPSARYSDWPGWKVFLFGESYRPYATWQEASIVCVRAKLRGQMDYYLNHYQVDPRLPSSPNEYYQDWPGWIAYLGKTVAPKDYYPTWQEASVAAVAAGFKSQASYFSLYKKIDSRLPYRPNNVYEDWPGWKIFLATDQDNYYASWEEASEASRRFGYNTQREYEARDKNIDPRLHNYPHVLYKDWPGWAVFCGRAKKDFYPTWQEASVSALQQGITSQDEYLRHYKQADPRLPGNPYQYYPDWPGWKIFMGKAPKVFYATWQEASAAARSLRIRSSSDYVRKHRLDARLHSYPGHKYPDWPGWDIFLGRA